MAAILEMPQYVAYQKMLFVLLLNSVQSLTVLTFCAQWMALAALLLLALAEVITLRYCVQCISIALALCCDLFDLGSRQEISELRDPVDLKMVDHV